MGAVGISQPVHAINSSEENILKKLITGPPDSNLADQLFRRVIRPNQGIAEQKTSSRDVDASNKSEIHSNGMAGIVH
jgi:hypothetical protein